jgi:hypothetical protein
MVGWVKRLDHAFRCHASIYIQLQNLCNCLRMHRRGCFENSLNCTRDIDKTDTSFEECRDCYFIRCIQRDRVSTPCFRGFIGQSETRKANKIRRFEGQPAQGCHIESELRCDPLRVTQRIQDWQTHVRHRDLRQDAAVDKLH